MAPPETAHKSMKQKTDPAAAETARTTDSPAVVHERLVLSLREAVREFRENYQKSYERELEDAGRWIKWCEKHGDTHGMNYHQGKQGAHIDLNIEMHHLLKTLEIIGQNEKGQL